MSDLPSNLHMESTKRVGYIAVCCNCWTSITLNESGKWSHIAPGTCKHPQPEDER
jgi:hypothetical protein